MVALVYAPKPVKVPGRENNIKNTLIFCCAFVVVLIIGRVEHSYVSLTKS